MADKPKDPAPKARTLTAFSLHSRKEGDFKVWYALALKLNGRQVVDEKVLDSDDSLQVVATVMERALYDHSHYGVDPFAEVKG